MLQINQSKSILVLYWNSTDGRLRNIETGEGFVYEVKKGKKKYNQRLYTELGEVITDIEKYLGILYKGLPLGNKFWLLFRMVESTNCSFQTLVIFYIAVGLILQWWLLRLHGETPLYMYVCRYK